MADKVQPMTKSELVSVLADKTGMTKKDVGSFLDLVADIACKETKKKGEFTLPGLGKLVKAHRKARMGRNPITGQTIKIPAKTVLKFKIAKAAKDSVLGAK
jgi:DNA-binding protein HU-beta